VSSSGYYKWLNVSSSPDKDEADYLLIQKIFENKKRKAGWRTIQMELTTPMNHKKIQRIMKKYNLFCKIRRTNPYKMIAKKTAEHRVCENKLNREFDIVTPYHFFSTDITYIFYNHTLAYLSVVKDIATGEVIAWEVSKRLEMNIVLDTLIDLRNTITFNLKGILIHSDQGFHYTNPEYIRRVKELGMVQSMSRKGNCIDNCPIESFFGHFKDEVDYKQCKSFEELCLLINQYMKYYNYERKQWTRKKMTPVDYRNHLLAHR
jgi:putative transposase